MKKIFYIFLWFLLNSIYKITKSESSNIYDSNWCNENEIICEKINEYQYYNIIISIFFTFIFIFIIYIIIKKITELSKIEFKEKYFLLFSIILLLPLNIFIKLEIDGKILDYISFAKMVWSLINLLIFSLLIILFFYFILKFKKINNKINIFLLFIIFSLIIYPLYILNKPRKWITIWEWGLYLINYKCKSKIDWRACQVPWQLMLKGD